MTRGVQALVFSVTVAVCVHTSSAAACSPPAPTSIDSRYTYPPPGAVDVPTNARFVVIYDLTGNGQDPAWGLGTGVGIRRPGGPALDASATTNSVWYARSKQTLLVIKPQAELAPNTTYELFDHHPSLPCFSGNVKPCRAAMATTFATFTTGALPDTTPPQFDGLKVVSLPKSPTVCNNSACCGPYIVHQLSLQWNLGSDERTSPYLAYNVYRDGQLFIPIVGGDSLSGAQCGGGPYGPQLPAGTYTVRAVDWAGNEDGNSRVQTVPNLCSAIAAPADGGTDASIRSDVRPVNDSAVAQHDGAGAEVAPADGLKCLRAPAADAA